MAGTDFVAENVNHQSQKSPPDNRAYDNAEQQKRSFEGWRFVADSARRSEQNTKRQNCERVRNRESETCRKSPSTFALDVVLFSFLFSFHCCTGFFLKMLYPRASIRMPPIMPITVLCFTKKSDMNDKLNPVTTA